jgi:hypothetical protein
MNTLNLTQAIAPVNTDPIRVNWPNGQTTLLNREEPAQTSRREFLTQAATALALAPVAGLPKVESFAGKLPDGYILIKESDLEPVPDAPAPFGPADRTAVIDEWRARLDKAIVALESLWGYLGEARGLPAEQVDGVRFFDEQQRCFDQVEELFDAMAIADFEDLIEALSGKSCAFVITKREILAGNSRAEHLQIEIDSVRRNHGDAEADELQALLEASE